MSCDIGEAMLGLENEALSHEAEGLENEAMEWLEKEL